MSAFDMVAAITFWLELLTEFCLDESGVLPDPSFHVRGCAKARLPRHAYFSACRSAYAWLSGEMALLTDF